MSRCCPKHFTLATHCLMELCEIRSEEFLINFGPSLK